MAKDERTQIGPGTHVALSYVLFDEDGDVVDQADEGEPLEYVHGYGQIVPGLERALDGLFAGAAKEVTVEVDEAYGPHDPEGVFEVDKTDFPDPTTVQINDEFMAEGDDGLEVPMRVIDILDDAFVVDTNHPLAGQRLRFQVKIGAVRPATDDEIKQAEHDLAHAEEHDHDHSGCGHDHSHDHEQTGLISIGKKPLPSLSKDLTTMTNALKNPWLTDVRVRDRNVKKGHFEQKDVDKFLAELPDVAEQAEAIGIPQPALDEPEDDLDDEDDDESDESES